ncbi:MAG: single-stranded DNA-binding protein [bacterium]|nr:single-stranded DNA-binding protein [bacterium]
MNLNKVLLIGNLTRDPEMRSLPSGQPVASFGLATNRAWSKNGQKQTQAEFHNIVAFGRLAEIASQYLSKGKMAYIEGRIQTRSWQDKEGNKKNRTEVIAERLQLGPRGAPLGKPADLPAESPSVNQAGKEDLETIEYPAEEINPDEIPF